MQLIIERLVIQAKIGINGEGQNPQKFTMKANTK